MLDFYFENFKREVLSEKLTKLDFRFFTLNHDEYAQLTILLNGIDLSSYKFKFTGQQLVGLYNAGFSNFLSLSEVRSSSEVSIKRVLDFFLLLKKRSYIVDLFDLPGVYRGQSRDGLTAVLKEKFKKAFSADVFIEIFGVEFFREFHGVWQRTQLAHKAMTPALSSDDEFGVIESTEDLCAAVSFGFDDYFSGNFSSAPGVLDVLYLCVKHDVVSDVDVVHFISHRLSSGLSSVSLSVEQFEKLSKLRFEALSGKIDNPKYNVEGKDLSSIDFSSFEFVDRTLRFVKCNLNDTVWPFVSGSLKNVSFVDCDLEDVVLPALLNAGASVTLNWRNVAQYRLLDSSVFEDLNHTIILSDELENEEFLENLKSDDFSLFGVRISIALYIKLYELGRRDFCGIKFYENRFCNVVFSGVNLSGASFIQPYRAAELCFDDVNFVDCEIDSNNLVIDYRVLVLGDDSKFDHSLIDALDFNVLSLRASSDTVERLRVFYGGEIKLILGVDQNIPSHPCLRPVFQYEIKGIADSYDAGRREFFGIEFSFVDFSKFELIEANFAGSIFSNCTLTVNQYQKWHSDIIISQKLTIINGSIDIILFDVFKSSAELLSVVIDFSHVTMDAAQFLELVNFSKVNLNDITLNESVIDVSVLPYLNHGYITLTYEQLMWLAQYRVPLSARIKCKFTPEFLQIDLASLYERCFSSFSSMEHYSKMEFFRFAFSAFKEMTISQRDFLQSINFSVSLTVADSPAQTAPAIVDEYLPHVGLSTDLRCKKVKGADLRVFGDVLAIDELTLLEGCTLSWDQLYNLADHHRTTDGGVPHVFTIARNRWSILVEEIPGFVTVDSWFGRYYLAYNDLYFPLDMFGFDLIQVRKLVRLGLRDVRAIKLRSGVNFSDDESFSHVNWPLDFVKSVVNKRMLLHWKSATEVKPILVEGEVLDVCPRLRVDINSFESLELARNFNLGPDVHSRRYWLTSSEGFKKRVIDLYKVISMVLGQPSDVMILENLNERLFVHEFLFGKNTLLERIAGLVLIHKAQFDISNKQLFLDCHVLVFKSKYLLARYKFRGETFSKVSNLESVALDTFDPSTSGNELDRMIREGVLGHVSVVGQTPAPAPAAGAGGTLGGPGTGVSSRCAGTPTPGFFFFGGAGAGAPAGGAVVDTGTDADITKLFDYIKLPSGGEGKGVEFVRIDSERKP